MPTGQQQLLFLRKKTPCVPKCRSFYFCPKSNFSKLTNLYKNVLTSTRPNKSSIDIFHSGLMKLVAFVVVDVIAFFYKFDQS